MNIPIQVKSVFLVLAKVAITIIFFYFIIRKINISDVLNAPVQNKAYLIYAFALSLLVVVIQGFRWHLLCRFIGVGSDMHLNIKAVWSGHFLNNILPTSAVGDVLRSYALRNRGAHRTQWVSALLVEKYFAVITALLLSGFVVISNQLTSNIPFIIEFLVICILLVVTSASLLMRLIGIICSKFLPGSLVRFLNAMSMTISKSVMDQTGMLTITTSLLVNFCICVIFFCVAQAMGLNIGILDCMFIVPVFTILAGLPISYGGWGVREMTSIHLLQYYGVSSEIALFTSVLFGIIIFASSLPGIIFLPTFRDALITKKLHSA